MRPIGVTGMERVPAFPDLPTLREQGIAITTTGWFGLVAPAGVPEAILDRLDGELAAALEEPPLRARILAGGALPWVLRRADFARFMTEESERLGAIIRAVGVRAE